MGLILFFLVVMAIFSQVLFEILCYVTNNKHKLLIGSFVVLLYLGISVMVWKDYFL